MRGKRFYEQAVIVVFTCCAVGTLFAASTVDRLKIPDGFKHWYLVNSMLVTKEPNKFGLITGVYLIYVNPTGLPGLKRGESAPYPDGTVFVDDVREISLEDGAYQEGVRKAIPVMVKDSRKYASTGGWGFQAWADGNPNKSIVTHAATQCFVCHMPQKEHDFVFSRYLE
jgi:hypothetical protein